MENSEISWTDNTFNPWIGCTKITPGCDHCYANTLNKRCGHDNWGKGEARRVTSDSYWRKPLKWNRLAQDTGQRIKVFCGSMCDWADKSAPDGVRDDLWSLIRQTPNLQWLMLTKRPVQAKKFLPDDWGEGYAHVALGVTVENRKHGLPRIEVLRRTPTKVRFLSIEPLLEDLGALDLSGIHWVIVGGESGHGYRPMERVWVDRIRRQCDEQGVTFFFKQWGGTGKGKGGCLLDEQEVKAFPIQFSVGRPMPLRTVLNG